MTLIDKIYSWGLQEGGSSILLAQRSIEHLAENLYDEYEPTRGPQERFQVRLEKWIGNVSSDDQQKSLYQLIPHIFYLGPRELEILYRIAYHTYLTRWLIEMLGLMLDEDIEVRLKLAVKETWICPITDSMRINAFYHLNNLTGREFRPDWMSLATLGHKRKIRNYIASSGIKQILLIEDFVGTGVQMEEAIIFAAETTGLPILVIPLIICPEGVVTAQSLTTRYPQVSFAPVISLQKTSFIRPRGSAEEPQIFKKIRPIIKSTYKQLQQNASGTDSSPLYEAFGFLNTGSLVVMYTNCPDNTLPLIHHKSDNWNPLFPRASRV